MAMFVHLTAESRLPRIRRSGISRLRKAAGVSHEGVFAVPVTRNFYASHQWLRELKQRNQGPIAGVYFRIPDDQPVWVGHYGQSHALMTAAEAVALFMQSDDPMGWEVVIPCRVDANQIHKIRLLPQVMLEVLPQRERQGAALHVQVLYWRRVWKRQDAETARIT